jgi:Cdc6-like AAA superfamily ATPase
MAPGRGRPSGGVLGRGDESLPKAHVDPSELMVPGNSLDAGSRFYITRYADKEAFRTVSDPYAMVTILGARQTGKTSLLVRLFPNMNSLDRNIMVVFVDFQQISYKEFESLSLIWRAIAEEVARQLHLDLWTRTRWELDLSHDINFTNFLEHFVFNNCEKPLVICMDNIDILFHWPIKSEFFSSVRAFYNRAVTDHTWKRVRWLLGTTSETKLFYQ